MPRTECDGCVLLTLPCLPPSKMDAGGYIESTEFQTVLLSVSPLPSRRRTYRWLTFLLFLRLCTPFSLQEARLDVHVASSFFFSMVFTLSTFRPIFPTNPSPTNHHPSPFHFRVRVCRVVKRFQTWSKMRTKIQAGCKMEPKVAVCGGLVGFALGFPRELRRCTDGLPHWLLPNLPCMHADGSFIERWEELASWILSSVCSAR